MIKVVLTLAGVGSIVVLWNYVQPEAHDSPLIQTVSATATSDTMYERAAVRIAELERNLLAETRVRRELELQIIELEQQLSRHQVLEAELDDDTDAATSQHTLEPGTGLSEHDTPEQVEINRSIIDQIQQRHDESRMALVSLRDRAAREGWIGTDRYNVEITGLFDPSARIRDEFGDDAYDRYLHATGKPNRVEINTVYDNSAAVVAGIQAGDILRQYGSQTVFSIRDLRLASMGGTAGEPVLVELLRDGASVYVTVPQGPIGIELNAVYLPPSDQQDDL